MRQKNTKQIKVKIIKKNSKTFQIFWFILGYSIIIRRIVYQLCFLFTCCSTGRVNWLHLQHVIRRTALRYSIAMLSAKKQNAKNQGWNDLKPKNWLKWFWFVWEEFLNHTENLGSAVHFCHLLFEGQQQFIRPTASICSTNRIKVFHLHASYSTDSIKFFLCQIMHQKSRLKRIKSRKICFKLPVLIRQKVLRAFYIKKNANSFQYCPYG